jgi:hypothetical protein
MQASHFGYNFSRLQLSFGWQLQAVATRGHRTNGATGNIIVGVTENL